MKKQIIYIFKTLLLALAVFILSHLVGDLLYGKDEKTLIIAMAAFLAAELVICSGTIIFEIRKTRKE